MKISCVNIFLSVPVVRIVMKRFAFLTALEKVIRRCLEMSYLWMIQCLNPLIKFTKLTL